MSAALWHDVECAGYDADLPAWRRLAADHPGPLLDVGCGTGRVALDLAAHGHEVTGLDSEPELVEALRARAADRGLEIEAVAGDARDFDLGRSFALVMAPMQVVQLLGGRDGRAAFIGCAWDHLDSGGLLALTLADPYEGEQPEVAVELLPDVLEQEGWVYSSTPVTVRADSEGVTVERVREAAAPDGKVLRSGYSITLDLVSPRELEAEAREVGFRKRPRIHVEATELYVGTTIVCMVKP